MSASKRLKIGIATPLPKRMPGRVAPDNAQTGFDPYPFERV
jgi:hypothetical protein